MRNAIKAALVAFALALASSVAAQDFDAGWEAAQRDDYVAAEREWRPLAEQGHAVAQNNLGVMYFNGQGVAQDHVQAHMWFALAASQGERGATINRKRVARLMTPEKIAEAERLAREWKPK